MGKILKSILGSLLFISADSQSYEVSSCNDAETLRPALTVKIAEDYFNNNLSSQTAVFDLKNGYYEKTIPEAELNFEFGTDDDVIILSYTLATTSAGFDLTDDSKISFADETIQFQCRYARTITTDSTYDVATLEPQTAVGNGMLAYDLNVNVGGLGGTSTALISPNHSFGSKIYPSLTECRISSGHHEIYAMHSFGDEVCFDNTRLKVVQTQFGSSVGFNFSGAEGGEIQQQTVSCTLHLNPADDSTNQSQADDCDCYTKTECEKTNQVLNESNGAVLFLSTEEHKLVPMVMNVNGEYDDDIDFTFEDTNLDPWDIRATCAATFNNEMWLLGGESSPSNPAAQRQIRKVTNCALKNVGELDFNFRYGGCNTFTFGIMLCFHKSSDANDWSLENSFKECHSFDGESTKREVSTEFKHPDGQLGNYKGSPFVTGGSPNPRGNGLITEILDIEAGTWVQADDYPFSGDRIVHYVTAHTDESVFVISSWTNQLLGEPSRTIAEYKDGTWRNVGNMTVYRHGHRSIQLGSTVMVVGGSKLGNTYNTDPAETEKWDLNTLESHIINPMVDFPGGMFIVPFGYCSRN